MKWTPQFTRILVAVLIGTILGIIISLVFGYWLWIPLMIGVCFIFSLWCKSSSEIPEKEEQKVYDH